MRIIIFALLALLGLAATAHADGVCPRPEIGAEVQQPPSLFSENGKLDVALGYYTTVDKLGVVMARPRPQDRLVACELHPEDARHLSRDRTIG